jgi:hypothetical protein
MRIDRATRADIDPSSPAFELMDFDGYKEHNLCLSRVAPNDSLFEDGAILVVRHSPASMPL